MSAATESANPKAPKRGGVLRSLLRIAAALLIAYALYVGLGAALFGRVLFPTGLIGSVEGGPEPPQGFEAIWITAPDGSRVEAWFFLGEGCTPDRPGPALMYFHGNAELIGHNADLARRFAEMGVSTLLVEYRGYGRSGGAPSEHALVEDARAFLDRFLSCPEVDADRLVYFGRSLGSGVAAQLAVHRPPKAMVLHSPFTSVAAMGARYGLPQFLCPYPFRSDRALAGATFPVLIFHGERDEVIPFSHGRRLHELIPGSEFVPLEGGHNDTPRDWREYEQVLKNFLSRHAVIEISGR